MDHNKNIAEELTAWAIISIIPPALDRLIRKDFIYYFRVENFIFSQCSNYRPMVPWRVVAKS